jgi:hypothetical protein
VKKTKNTFQTMNRFPQTNIPIDSVRQAEKHVISKIFKIGFSGTTGEISWEITTLNNFSTVRPIFTNGIVVDSSQQGEQN